MKLGSLKTLLVSSSLGLAAVLAIATGCSRDNVAKASPAETQPEQLQDEPQSYTIDTATVGDCKAGAECTATIKITAKGEYHVNETYPFRFTANAVPGVDFKGSGGNVYTGGDFARQGKTAGVMTVKFVPKDKGSITIAGPYKICICTDKICQPTTTNVSFAVNVK